MQTSDFIQAAIKDRTVCLSLRVRPASVRDSMWRAHSTVRTLVDQGKIGASTRICVIGLGPSGMTAAAECLKAGARVFVLDTKPDNGSRLDESSFRYICPTTFDFPSPHWVGKYFPIDSQMDWLLPWGQGVASDVVSAIREQYLLVCNESGGRISNLKPSDWNYPSPQSNGLVSIGFRVPIGEDPSVQTTETLQDIDYVFFAVGPGRHTVTLDGSSFASFDYWSNSDPLLNNSSSRRSDATAWTKRVLLAGGSDGGTQDFCTLLTGFANTFDLMTALATRLSAGDLSKLQQLCRRDWHSFANPGARSEHDRLAECHRELMEFCDETWSNNRLLRNDCLRMIERNSSRPTVQLSFVCEHFDTTYFANRVACQLLARAISAKPELNDGLAPFIINSAIANIESDHQAHSCRGDPQECSRYPHSVTFKQVSCSEHVADQLLQERYRNSASGSPPWKQTVAPFAEKIVFDRVVLRFGASLAKSARVPASLVQRINSVSPIRSVPEFYLHA